MLQQVRQVPSDTEAEGGSPEAPRPQMRCHLGNVNRYFAEKL